MVIPFMKSEPSQLGHFSKALWNENPGGWRQMARKLVMCCGAEITLGTTWNEIQKGAYMNMYLFINGCYGENRLMDIGQSRSSCRVLPFCLGWMEPAVRSPTTTREQACVFSLVLSSHEPRENHASIRPETPKSLAERILTTAPPAALRTKPLWQELLGTFQCKL